MARLGALEDATRQPALIAEIDGDLAGVLTWVLRGRSMEVLTLHAARQWAGAGTALVAAARRVAEASGARRLWLITTNDNVDALRFYQRRGFRLARVHAGAVDRSRAALKPGIPEAGDHGIPLRDELELEMTIGSLPEPVASVADELLALELALARRRRARDPRRLRGGRWPRTSARSARVGGAGRAPRPSSPSTPSRPTRPSRSRPSRSPTSVPTSSSRPMTRAASHPTARNAEAAAARSGSVTTTAGSSASTRAHASRTAPRLVRRRNACNNNTGLITDFDTPRNGNLGDVHADSALEEQRRATK